MAVVSKLSKFLKSDAGRIVAPLAMEYAKRQSADVRRVAAIAEPILQATQAVRNASADPLRNTVFGTAPSGLLHAEPELGTIPSGGNMDFINRLTSRKFLATVGAALTALGAAYAAWQTAGIPVDQKIQLTMAALAAIVAVVTTYTHTEGTIDKTTIAANANTNAAVAAAVGNVVNPAANAASPVTAPAPAAPVAPTPANLLTPSTVTTDDDTPSE